MKVLLENMINLLNTAVLILEWKNKKLDFILFFFEKKGMIFISQFFLFDFFFVFFKI